MPSFKLSSYQCACRKRPSHQLSSYQLQLSPQRGHHTNLNLQQKSALTNINSQTSSYQPSCLAKSIMPRTCSLTRLAIKASLPDYESRPDNIPPLHAINENIVIEEDVPDSTKLIDVDSIAAHGAAAAKLVKSLTRSLIRLSIKASFP